MNTQEKLRGILTNLDNKPKDLFLEPDAFHLRELVPTESYLEDIEVMF